MVFTQNHRHTLRKCAGHRVSIHNCLELAGAVAFDARNAVRKGVPAADPGVAKEQAVLS